MLHIEAVQFYYMLAKRLHGVHYKGCALIHTHIRCYCSYFNLSVFNVIGHITLLNLCFLTGPIMSFVPASRKHSLGGDK